jgi:hypothetical protein
MLTAPRTGRMPTSRLNLHVDLLSHTHRVSCRVPASPSGLVALLNDTTTSVLEVEEAYVSRLAQPAKILSQCESGYIQKASIVLCILTRQEDIGPPGMARGGFSHVTRVPATITTAQFELEGELEVLGKFDAAELLVSGTGRFFPLYGASARATTYPELPFEGGVILVNRQLVLLVAPANMGKA